MIQPDEHLGKKGNEINLIELLVIIIKYRWMIIGFTLLASILTVIYSLKLPNIYKATAKIFPPAKESSSLNALASQLPGGMASIASGALGIKDPSELYIGMLRSHAINDKIIEKFDLMKVYEATHINEVRGIVEGNSSFEADKKSGIISISVEDESPERAAGIANEYVNLLRGLNNKINLTSAQKERIFLEQRLKIAKDELVTAQENFKKFQQENKAIDIYVQGKSVMEAGASLQGLIIESEVELKSLQTLLSPDSARIRALKEKIKELKKQLKGIEGNNNILLSDSDNISSKFYTPISDIPAISVKYADLFREVKIQETLFEILIKQYELAKINEARESSNIQVLDLAEVPGKNEIIRPKRRRMIMIVSFSAFFLSIFLAFFIEWIKKINQNDPDGYQKLNMIKNSITTDFKKILFWKN